MNLFTEEQLNRISSLVREIEKLNDVEKLYLYLQLPNGRASIEENGGKHRSDDDHNHKAPISGSRSNFSDLFTKKPDQETSQTYTWILSHLEIDPNVSLPKQEVYDEYRAFCQANRFEPLCVADFGKAMKHAFPCIKPRRLGQRGNSRYCYSGLRKKYRLQPPSLPIIGAESRFASTYTNDVPPSTNSGAVGGFCDHYMTNKVADYPLGSFETYRPNPKSSNGSTQSDYESKYEVMNLKVEPQSEMTDTTGRTFYSNDVGQSMNTLEQSIIKQTAVPHLGQQPQQLAIANQPLIADQSSSLACLDTSQVCLANKPPVRSVLQQQNDLFVANRCAYNPVHPVVTATALHPPRSPDDDEYHHYYQDMLPAIQRMSTYGDNQDKSIIEPQQSVHLSAAQANINGQIFGPFTQNSMTKSVKDPPTTPITTFPLSNVSQQSLSSRPLMTVDRAADDQQHLQQQQQPQPVTHSIQPPLRDHQFSHLPATFAGAHMDSCASPFQSPASTPYPNMIASGYASHDALTDYYSDECFRYQS